MYGDQAAPIFLASVGKGCILDVGAGADSPFKGLCLSAGIEYMPFDLINGHDWEGQIPNSHIGDFDGIWMSHCLEHMLDTHRAIKRVFTCLKPNGVACITVPPMKRQIVGGHVSLWNAGLLLYRMILAGFDCRDAAVKSYGYNISVIVRKRQAELPPLKHDCGDIQALSQFFPFEATHGFDGDIAEMNWRSV